VRLVGAWDAYLLGHGDRRLILDPRRARTVNRGGGWLHPVLLVEGRVRGVWSTERKGRRVALTVRPFGPVPREARDGIRSEAEDVGRFLGEPVDLAFSG
jgi:winged helix DNA-binding protein